MLKECVLALGNNRHTQNVVLIVAIFSGIIHENAKFIHCSFHSTDLFQFDFAETEFIDCTFSGKLYAILNF